MSLSVLLNWLVTVYFIGEVEQKRRAQSFLSGQEPKAGKLVRSEKSPEWIFHSFLRPGEILLVAYWEDQNNCPYSRAFKHVAQGSLGTALKKKTKIKTTKTQKEKKPKTKTQTTKKTEKNQLFSEKWCSTLTNVTLKGYTPLSSKIKVVRIYLSSTSLRMTYWDRNVLQPQGEMKSQDFGIRILRRDQWAVRCACY